jgi:hypothetical protein
MQMYVAPNRAGGRVYYRIMEWWREGGKRHCVPVVSLGTNADPAEALAEKKRRRAGLKRRLARLGPGAVKERERLDRSLRRLSIDIAKVEMYLGGPRLLVITPCGGIIYQRTGAPKPEEHHARRRG